MPAHDCTPITTTNRAASVGPRQLEILELLWMRGPATVRQLLGWQTATPPLAYNTILTLCVRLTEKGLLERRLATNVDESARHGQAYIYTSRMSRDELLRGAHRQQMGGLPVTLPSLVQKQNANCDRAQIEQVLAELGTLCDRAGKRTDDRILDTIAALLERAENAERTAMAWEARVRAAELQVQAAERRAVAGERRAEQAERRLERLAQQLNRPPRPERKRRRSLGIAVEHRDPSGICRVCAQPAPPAHGLRQDDLRVCLNEDCRQEARRRDSVIKQRRYDERRSAHKATLQLSRTEQE